MIQMTKEFLPRYDFYKPYQNFYLTKEVLWRSKSYSKQLQISVVAPGAIFLESPLYITNVAGRRFFFPVSFGVDANLPNVHGENYRKFLSYFYLLISI